MLTRWEPFRELRRMQNFLDRVYDDAWSEGGILPDSREGLAPIDMYETSDMVVLEAVMPGVTADDINISMDRDVLTIRAETTHEEETNGKEDRNYYRREIHHRSYVRSIRLPTLVDVEKTDAEFENGILTLRLPKAEEVKPKQISVKAK